MTKPPEQFQLFENCYLMSHLKMNIVLLLNFSSAKYKLDFIAVRQDNFTKEYKAITTCFCRSFLKSWTFEFWSQKVRLLKRVAI
jgi:hypothetical protein